MNEPQAPDEQSSTTLTPDDGFPLGEPEARADAPTPQPPTSLAAFAVGNPHLVLVACLLSAILGGLALKKLPIDLLPPANLPAVQILSFYAGMPVERVEKNLTARFERYTGQAVGLERQESRSISGVSVVRNFFDSRTDLNTAIAQTTSLVLSVLRRLPPGTQPPLILPFDPLSAVPLALVAVSADRPEKDLYDIARYRVRNTVQGIPGALAPTVMGGSERQVVVYLDPDKLKDRNLSPFAVAERIQRLNTFIPSGSVRIGDEELPILSNGMVEKLTEMDDFPLRAQNEVPVRLRDVGKASDAAKIQTNVVRIDGERQVYVPVYKQPGANTLAITDSLGESLRALAAEATGYTFKVVADQSRFVKNAIQSIATEAVLGGGLAALLVLLLLGSVRSTAAVALSLPLSFLCAFLGLSAVGETINAMTLGGLALSVGVLIDNSIVVLENINRKLSEGSSLRYAAVEGAREVAMPILASTLATLAVLFPVFYLQGITKILFGSLAKAVAFAMIGSFLSASTVIPLFSSRFLSAPVPPTRRWGILRWSGLAMAWLTARYKTFLRRWLDWGIAPVALPVACVIPALFAFPFVGTELFPRTDAGNLTVTARLASGTSLKVTETKASAFETAVREIGGKEITTIIANVGVYYGFPAAFTPNAGPNDFFLNVEMSPDRRRTSQDLAREIRAMAKERFPELELGFELGGLLSSAINGGLRAPLDVRVTGPDAKTAWSAAKDLASRLSAVPGAVDVRVQQRFDAPQLDLTVDRAKAGRLGLATDEVVKNVVSALSGSSIFSPAIWVDPRSGIDYLMGVQFPENEVTSVDDLLNVPITGTHQARSVPLRWIASVSRDEGPTELNHINLKPVINILADVDSKDIGSVGRDFDKVIAATTLPDGYRAEQEGEYRKMKRSVGDLGGGFVLAAVLVYLILVVQFRSFLVPATVLAVIPFGACGIVTLFAVTGTHFSVQGAIGAIFMIGIAVANGVLLVEFIAHCRADGHSLEEAVIEGAAARLRPILMTSLASMLGILPMALGLGHGAEANVPLARAVIGGQATATVLILLFLPWLYRAVARRGGAP
jgi:CzcA family heavy metal efflux pump